MVKNLKSHSVCCPHIKVDENDYIEGMLAECQFITLSADLEGGQTLMLCGPCWDIVRAKAFDFALGKYASAAAIADRKLPS